MRRLLSWVVDHPALAGAALLVLTVLLALALPRLRIDESAEGLIVEHDPARAFYDQARRRFGSDNLTVLLAFRTVQGALGALGVLALAVWRWGDPDERVVRPGRAGGRPRGQRDLREDCFTEAELTR